MYSFKLLLVLFVINILGLALSAVTNTTTTVNQSTATATATNGASATATTKTKVTKKTTFYNGSYDENNNNNNNNNGTDCGECNGAVPGVINAANAFTFHFLKYIMETSDEFDDITGIPLNGFVLICYLASYSFGQTWESAKVFCGAEQREQLRCSLTVMHGYSQNPPKGIDYEYGPNFVTNYKVTDALAHGLDVITSAAVRQYNYWKPLILKKMINGFIAEQTNNKVRKAITKPSIFKNDPKSRRAVYATGIYFKGKWQREFDASNITIRDYFDKQNNVIRVPYIYQRNVYLHTWSSELDLDVVSIPFVNGFFNCVVLIPRKKCSSKLHELVEKISVPETFANLLASLKPACIQYIAPYYDNVESETDLGEGLQNTGKLDRFFDPEISEFKNAENGTKLDNFYIGGIRLKTIVNNTLSGVEPPSNECPDSENLEEYTLLSDHPCILAIENNGLIRSITIGAVRKSEEY